MYRNFKQLVPPPWRGRLGGGKGKRLNTLPSPLVGEGLGEGYFSADTIMGKIANTNQANSILSDTSLGIYTYCLTRTRKSFPHTMMGIDGIHGVYLAEQDGIFAVISDVSLKEYNEETLEKNMTDVAWIIPSGKRHEEVIEFVMTHATLNQHV